MLSLKCLCTAGIEDAVTVQAGTFSWDRNEKPVLEKCVCVVCVCECVCVHTCNIVISLSFN